MKKGIIVATSIAVITTLLWGCTNPTLPSNVAQRLEYSINSLASTVKNLDTIDNQYLTNPDISPVINNTAMSASSMVPNKKNKNAFLTTVNAASYAMFEEEKQPLEQTSTLATTNETENVQQETDNKVVNTTGNEKVVASEEKETSVTTIENATEQNNSAIDTQSTLQEVAQETNYNHALNQKVATLDEQNAQNTQNNQNDSINNNDNYNNETLQYNNANLQENIDKEKIVNEELSGDHLLNIDNLDSNNALDNNNELDNNNYNYYKYRPRYINNVNNSNTDSAYMNSYMNKVENLYSMTNDAVEANNTLKETKENIIECIKELKRLAVEMKEGNYVPNSQQITAINNYITDIKSAIAKIRSVNGQLNNEVNKINNYDKEGITTSIDVLNSNYLRILNHLDIRITYLKNALSTLEQVKALLLEAQILDGVEQQTQYTDNAENISAKQRQNNEVVEKESVTMQDYYYEDSNNDYEMAEESEQIYYDNKKVYQEQTETNNEQDIIKYGTNQSRATSYKNPTYARNKRVFNGNNANTEKENTAKQQPYYDPAVLNETNIDTYKRANIDNSYRTRNGLRELRNIDTYNNHPKTRLNNTNSNTDTVMQNDNNNVNNTSFNQNANNGNVANNNATNDVANGGIANGTTGSVANGGIANGTTGGVANGGIANGVNGGVTNLDPQNENYINAPSGTFQNGIITQNNLNQGTNAGVNGVRSGYSSSQNNPYTVDGRGNNKNIDTYGYNSMVDIINRGTVNNGINTLSLTPDDITSAKPNMVNGENVLTINPESSKVKLPELKNIIA